MKFVDLIKNLDQVEVRTSSDQYFEAVFVSRDIDKVNEILKNDLGEPVKPAKKDIRLAKDMQKMADSMGGIRFEQSLYARKESDGDYTYAALWPWQSNPSNITLKAGMYSAKG